jgi:hypothetical protein
MRRKPTFDVGFASIRDCKTNVQLQKLRKNDYANQVMAKDHVNDILSGPNFSAAKGGSAVPYTSRTTRSQYEDDIYYRRRTGSNARFVHNCIMSNVDFTSGNHDVFKIYS